MTYQVLARKWRPKSFQEFIGQETVVQALKHALDQQRLHHAYLLTGTRGVGKTTLARILVKCFNCEQGISAQPCGICSSCQEVDQGRFIDLIEVDAASRTRVEDTRELLDNIQYKPTRGRYKIYLIDEVHMLSTHSFNALLKTLEEPPEHVKFLLATTDPQKLPITILSRCLQFTLKNVPAEKIVQHLSSLLEKEKIEFELPALWALARAGEGSVRDALSLTDQAIAFSGECLAVDAVEAMLGTVDRGRLMKLCQALLDHQISQGLQLIREWDAQGISFSRVLADLAEIFHRIAIAQIAPEALDNSLGDRDAILTLADRITPEDTQLFYEITVIGRRDLTLGPDPRTAMEMVLLRLYLFKPETIQKIVMPEVSLSSPALLPEKTLQACVESTSPVAPMIHQPPEAWSELLEHLPLQGGSLNLARHCVLVNKTEQEYLFSLSPAYEMLKTSQSMQKLEAALQDYLAMPIKIKIELIASQQATPMQLQANQQAARLQNITEQIQQDPFVQQLSETFSATIIKNGIQPKSK